jgi:ribose transport system permease protein
MNTQRNVFRRISRQQEFGVAMILVGIVALFSILKPAFLSQENIYSLLKTLAFTGIVAVGETLIILSGDIDISVGSTAGLGAIVSTTIMMEWNCFGMLGTQAEWVGVLICIILGIAICSVVGFINAILIVKIKLPAFIVRGVVNVLTNGVPVYPLPETFMNGLGPAQIRLSEAGGLSLSFLLFVGLVIGFEFVLRMTTFGRNIYATGSNIQVAKLSGINTNRVRFYNFIITAMLAGLAGILVAAFTKQGYPPIGNSWELQVIAGTVIGGISLKGGTGSMIGTFIGVIIINALNTGLVMLGINTFIQTSIQGLMILAAVYIDLLRKNQKIKT